MQGSLSIEPVTDRVVVDVCGNSSSFTYDGGEHSAAGYQLKADNSLYDVSNVSFSGDACVSGSNAGVYRMGLSPEDFINKSANFTDVVLP